MTVEELERKLITETFDRRLIWHRQGTSTMYHAMLGVGFAAIVGVHLHHFSIYKNDRKMAGGLSIPLSHAVSQQVEDLATTLFDFEKGLATMPQPY